MRLSGQVLSIGHLQKFQRLAQQLNIMTGWERAGVRGVFGLSSLTRVLSGVGA